MQDDNVKSFQADAGESTVRILVTSLARLNPITAALADAYTQLTDEKRWRYVEEFFQDVTKDMQDHEDKLSELYNRTDPEESLHLMFIAIDKVKFEYQEARRKKYAELFVNSILLGNKINFDEKRMFIQLFGELSDADIILLGKFSHDNTVHLEEFRTIGSSEGLQMTIPLVSRLESRGLITEVYGALRITQWEGSPDNFDSKWRNKVYCLTPIGIKFSMFLKAGQ